jgi:hypothetical protein
MKSKEADIIEVESRLVVTRDRGRGGGLVSSFKARQEE